SRIDSALQNKILDQAPYIIICEGGADCGVQPEAASQAASHIVLASAFPDLELAGGAHPAFSRIEAEHDFTQSNQVVLTRTGRFVISNGHMVAIATDGRNGSKKKLACQFSMHVHQKLAGECVSTHRFCLRLESYSKAQTKTVS